MGDPDKKTGIYAEPSSHAPSKRLLLARLSDMVRFAAAHELGSYTERDIQEIKDAFAESETLPPTPAFSFWGKAHACHAPAATMCVGADGTWNCKTCGAHNKDSECMYGPKPEAPTPNGNAWIPCSERLPVSGDEVIAATRDGLVYQVPADRVIDGSSPPPIHFTHWMPLPSSPER